MALPTKAQRGAEKERARCAGIVRERLAHVQRVAATSGPPQRLYRKTDIAATLIKVLIDLEAKILDVPKEEKAAILPGDFSIEEMERAIEIIEEQERNPFEV
jgi:hypothetical protein